jgi:hypothetical protein
MADKSTEQTVSDDEPSEDDEVIDDKTITTASHGHFQVPMTQFLSQYPR